MGHPSLHRHRLSLRYEFCILAKIGGVALGSVALTTDVWLSPREVCVQQVFKWSKRWHRVRPRMHKKWLLDGGLCDIPNPMMAKVYEEVVPAEEMDSSPMNKDRMRFESKNRCESSIRERFLASILPEGLFYRGRQRRL